VSTYTLDWGNSNPHFMLMNNQGPQSPCSLYQFLESGEVPHKIFYIQVGDPLKLGELAKRWPKTEFINIGQKYSFKCPFHYSETLGADRKVIAEYLYQEKIFGPILDAGTFLTVDFLSREQGFLGGHIAPGLSTLLSLYQEKGAALPRLSLKNAYDYFHSHLLEDASIPRNTDEAILSSIALFYRALLVRAYENAQLYGQHFIVTGGTGELFQRWLTTSQLFKGLPMEVHFRPHLIHEAISALAHAL
jgi:pantothenate kinase type III